MDADRILPRVYAELHRLAQSYFRSQPAGHTLQPTALVHEAYLRLASSESPGWESREHFYCVAARAMRQILVNHARDRSRLKRGGGHRRVSLDSDGIAVGGEDDAADLLALEEALDALAEVDRRKSRIVELRYFAGLSIQETARVLEVSPATVKNDWAISKAWLLRRMSDA